MSVQILESGVSSELRYIEAVPVIPRSTKFIFETAQRLINRLQTQEDSPEFHRTRTELYVYLNILQKDLTQSPPPAFNNDQYLTNAEKVEKLLLFTQHPGAQHRLLPLAHEYLESFQAFRNCVHIDCPYDGVRFIQAVQDLGQRHTTFATAYWTELKEVNKYQPSMVNITHRADIEFFTLAFLSSLQNASVEDLDQLIKRVAESDDELVFQFCFLGLEYALQRNTTKLPELFRPFQDQFKALKRQYKLLPLKEKEGIRSNLSGKGQALSPAAQEVLRAIKAYAIEWQRSNSHQSQHYAAMLSSVYQEIGKSLCLARQLRKMLGSLPEDCIVRDQNLYQILLCAGLLLDDQTDSHFDFYTQREIRDLKRRYSSFSDEDKERVRRAAISRGSFETASEFGQFMEDVRNHANHLAGSNASHLLCRIFQLFRVPVELLEVEKYYISSSQCSAQGEGKETPKVQASSFFGKLFSRFFVL